MRRVDLFGLNQCALVVLEPSGVVYTNQVAGGMCRQNEAEGVLVPFDDELPSAAPHLALHIMLRELLRDVMGLTEAMADAVDEIFSRRAATSFVVVDRARVMDCYEAWLYVEIRETEFSSMSGFGKCKGILTWPNSD